MADLGVVGLAAALALLAAWLAAAARATGLLPRGRPRPQWTGERVAVTALALCVLVFGLHSLVDWTWFVPGPSAAAVAAAGFMAGRGPLGAPPERAPRAALSGSRLLAHGRRAGRRPRCARGRSGSPSAPRGRTSAR